MLSDLKYAFRQLGKNPGFATVAVLILALGIGANTAIFSLVDATLLKWLPVARPGQLVLLSWNPHLWPPKLGQTGGDARYSFSHPAFEEFRKDKPALASVFAFVPLGFTPENATVTIDSTPTTANGLMVSGGYFPGLGVNLPLGRGIAEGDEVDGAPRVAVIGHTYWVRHFNSDPGIIGRTFVLNNISFTVVGVAPEGFHGIMPFAGTDTDIWIAFADLPSLRPWGVPTSNWSFRTNPDWAFLSVVGRLDPAMPKAQAEARLDSDFRRTLLVHWKPARAEQVPHLQLVEGGRGIAGLRDQLAPSLTILMAGVTLLLLVACANLATLLLARANARQREISVRLALGATRWRITRQLLVESLLLAVIGGAAGLFVANLGIHALLGMISVGQSGQMGFEIELDSHVLMFAAASSLVTGILFGLAPAFRVAQLDLSSAMKQSAGAVSESRRGQKLGKGLVVAQVSASAALVVAAGLFVRTLQAMENRDLGFNQNQLVVFGLDPTREGYEGQRLMDLYGRIRREIQSLPGTESVSLIEGLPFNGSNNSNFKIVGSDRKIDNPSVRWSTVGPDFCQTMQIRLLAGRDIRDSDTSASLPVGLVNETFVHRFLGDVNPIGQHFTGLNGKTAFEIVGVFREVELNDLHATAKSKALVPYTQLPSGLTTMYFEVRTSGEPESMIAGLRAAIRRIDPGLPLMNLSTQTEVTQKAMIQERVLARLAGFFGVAALLLAAIGLYGTMAYSVARRTREIGIRVTLGATPRMVVGMILGQGLGLIALGIAIGFAASLGISQLIRGMLYGVGANDPATFGLAAVLIVIVALLACWIPARRAIKVDPIVALRVE